MNQELTPPDGFILDVFERDFKFTPTTMPIVWEKLQRRETFTQGQIFPYRVEFAAKSQKGEFSPGELNIHHGPFLSVHGAIGEVTSSYRSLNYFYGSYVISFRFVRPLKLEFYREGDTLKLKINVYIKPWLKPFWRCLNFIFWSGFKISMS
jgi:hypothetical protein